MPGETWIAAKEVEWFAAGSTIVFDADNIAYPKPFSQAAPGDYEFMALLDPDHSYARSAQDGGDLYSAVVTVRGINPADTAPVKLVITKLTPMRPKPVDTDDCEAGRVRESHAEQVLGPSDHDARGCRASAGLCRQRDEKISGGL